MAKDWYLTKRNPNITSGLEDSVMEHYAQSNFNDVLEIAFSDAVTLYSSDLSEQTSIKCVVQGGSPDSTLKSTEATVLCKIGTLKAGMYIYYDDAYWLVTSNPRNNKSYEKCVMNKCNWLLKWQDKNGNIIERWSVITSAAKYNNGEKVTNAIVVGSDQFLIQLPIDDASIYVNRGVKFFIDYNTENPTTYELTNPLNVINYYGENNGTTYWIAKETQYSPTETELELGVCNYVEPTTTTPTTVTLEGLDTIRVGIKGVYKVDGVTSFTITITGSVAFSKNVVDENTITLCVSDDDYIDEVFTINVIVDGNIVASKEVTVVDTF